MLELLGLFSLLTFVGSLIAVPWMIGRLPADYFLTHWQEVDQRRHRHFVVAIVLHVVRNFLGLLLLLAGIAMLVLPGQGLLTILVGLSVMDFPAKRKVLATVVAKGAVQRGLNWIRRKQGKMEFFYLES